MEEKDTGIVEVQQQILTHKKLVANHTSFLCKIRLALKNTELTPSEKIKLIGEIDLKYAYRDREIIAPKLAKSFKVIE